MRSRRQLQEEAPPLSSIGQLVDAMGGAGRGGGIGRVARALGVSPRTVERWFALSAAAPASAGRPRPLGPAGSRRSTAALPLASGTYGPIEVCASTRLSGGSADVGSRWTTT
jgi:hypothetical protein